MNLADIAIKRPVFTTMVALGLMVLGILSYSRLGVDLFPDVNFPIVTVTTVYPGAGPEEIEQLVTRPIEDALAPVANMDRVKSFSREGVSVVMAQFKLEADIKLGSMDVRDRVASIRGRLPREIQEPIINRLDLGAAPIMLYTVSSTQPPEETRRFADDVLKPTLESVEGVAAVNVSGGREREIQVNLSLSRLQALGLTPGLVAQVLSMENLDVPAGRFTANEKEATIRAKGQFRTVEEVANILLPVANGDSVRLREVAEVVDGFKEQRFRSRVNGEAAVVMEIIKQSGANSIAISNAVEKRLAGLGPRIPTDYSITKILDSKTFIEENTHEVNIAIWFGGAMAIFIIFIFMLDWRSTLISALALPTSVVTTFLAMSWMGFSLNMMSLLAISLAIGLLIDDAVVVRENIFRHIEMGKPPMQAASDGTREIALAVMATTFTIVAVFVPVGFMQGMVGQFFKQFGLTIAAAVMVSLFIAFTVDPMLSARLVKPLLHDQHERDLAHPFKGPILRFYQGLDQSYREILGWSLRHRAVVALSAAGLFIGSLLLVPYMGMEFFPKPDRGQFMINIEMPAGTSLDATDAAIARAEHLIAENPYITTLYSTIGNNSDPTRGAIRLLAVDKNERPQGLVEIMEEVRTKLRSIPDMKLTLTDIGFVDGMVEAPIQLNVRGDDYALLLPLAERVRDIVRATPGTADIDMTYSPGKPELQVSLDRDRAARLGVNMAQFGMGLRTAIEGDINNKLRVGEKEYDIRIRLREEDRNSRVLLEEYVFPNRMGRPVRLSEVGQVVESTGPSVIERENRQRQITIQGGVYGRSLGEVVADIQSELDRLEHPEGYAMRFAGEAERMADSLDSLTIALVLAIIFIYLVLASQFESFIHPFTIMLSLPLAIVGALLSLFLVGSPLGLSTFIGIILLMGLVTKNAILLVDYTNQMRDERGMDITSALLAAGPTRLRPILMTSFAMILGMLPTALGRGSGSEFRSPMAVAVIGGVITSTLLTLVVVPVVYTWFDRLTLRGRAERRAALRAHEAALAEAPARKDKDRDNEDEGGGLEAAPGRLRPAVTTALILIVGGASLFLGARALAGEPVPLPLAAAAAPAVAETSSPASSAPSSWGPERRITLEEALRLASQGNPDLATARARLQQTRLMMAKVIAYLQPNIKLQGSYLRNNAEAVLDFSEFTEGIFQYVDYQLLMNGLTPAPVPDSGEEGEPIVIQPLDQLNASASLTWGLFNARTISGLAVARSAVEAGGLGTEHLERELLFGVAQLYYNLYALQQVEGVSERLVESKQRHQTLAQARVHAGQVPQSEMLRAEVEVVQASRQLRETRQAVHNLGAELAILLGLSGVELRAQPPAVLEAASASDGLVDLALAQRKDVAATAAQIKVAQASVLDSGLAFLPTVALLGTYRWGNAGGFTGEETSWYVGAAAEIPVWDGGLKLIAARESRLQLQQAREQARKIELQVRKEVQVAWSALEQGRINLETAEQELRLARRTFEQIEALYAAGQLTALELRDAELLVTNAELNRVRTSVSLELAKLAIQRATGQFRLPAAP